MRKCKVGYVASFKIKSELLLEVIDAHGHDYQPQAIKCEGCRRAMKSEGLCDHCGIGFVGDKLYVSRSMYSLAKGKPIHKTTLTCATCHKHAESHGWCDACDAGMVGNVKFSDRKEYEEAASKLPRLLAALKKLKECEMCAVTLFLGSSCPTCKIDYSNWRKPRTPTNTAARDKSHAKAGQRNDR